MFDPYAAWHAARHAGMLVSANVTIGTTTYTGVYVKWAQPDALYLQDGAQQTDFHIEYRSIDLPGLARGSTVTIAGADYQVIEPPAFSPNKSGGHYSTARLKAIVRAAPKQPVNYTA